MDGAVLAFGWEPRHGECEVRGAVWPLPAMQAATIPPSQLSLHFRVQIFIKAVPVHHAEQDNKYSVFTPCSQPISGSHLSTHFYLSLKTQIKTLMLVSNL